MGTTVTVLFKNGEVGEADDAERNRGIDGSDENL